MSSYTNDINAVSELVQAKGDSWAAINPESVARMRAQNKFKTGLDIAQYTADIMNADMAAFDADNTLYTQSLGCAVTFIFLVGWWRPYALSLVLYPINQCMKKPRLLH